jgi:hypothetical protein
MKNLSLLIALCCLPAVAQTRLISHKSHSGIMATFSTALDNSLFDIAASNFGEPPSERRFTIDSIIFLPDNRAVVVSSEKEVWITARQPEIEFKPGRDTLYNHPLLSKQHAKDSVARQLGGWHNDVKLVNYDNEKPETAPKQEKKNSLPALPFGGDNFPGKPLLIAGLAMVSVLFGFVFFALHKLKSARLTA